jgi:hypothetical protein
MTTEAADVLTKQREAAAIDAATTRARQYLVANRQLVTEDDLGLLVSMFLEFYHRGAVDACDGVRERLQLVTEDGR